MTTDLVIEAPRAVVDGVERPCAVVVRDGVVTAVEDIPAERPGTDAAEVVRLDDDVVLLPGLVDTHVHCNDPGRADWEGFDHATRAAAAGGVTTIVDMPLNSVPPTTDTGALSAKRAAAEGRCFVDVGFWGGAVPDNGHDLHGLWDEGVLGFKCFLADSGVSEFPALDQPGLHRAAEAVAAFGGLLLVHAEDPDALREPEGDDYAGWAASRPPAAEVAAVDAVVEASRASGCRMHVVHLAAADALKLVRAAHDAGVQVTASPSCSELMPPHASARPRPSVDLSSAGHGEWSVTTIASVPSPSPAHRPSRLAASRRGGQHLYDASPAGASSPVSVR